MVGGFLRRFAGWRTRLRRPADPLQGSALPWARRRTALAITSPAFVFLEIVATPLIGFVISATAGAVTALALVVVTFVGSLVLAPVAQRNSLREQITGRDDDLRFTGSLEHVRWEFDLPFKPGGRIFTIHTQAVAWVWVKNNGPTATVAAAINDVTGVPSDWDDYFVAEAAWDQKHSATVVIPHQGRRRLKSQVGGSGVTPRRLSSRGL